MNMGVASRVRRIPPLLIVLVAVVLQWGVYLYQGYDRHTNAWCMIHPDTMHTLLFARTWVHGHPLRFHPSEPPSTMHSDLLTPLLYSGGYWLGFRSPSSFVLWAYIVCLLVAMLSALALWRFFRKFASEAAFPAVLCCMLFPGIFTNVFSSNFGFFFLFFWSALAFLDSRPAFIAFAVLAGLTRPEGLLVYLFLCGLYVATHRIRPPWQLAVGIPVLCVPPLVFRHLTGSFIPQGVVPQNIIRYQGLLNALYLACSTITDQVKGTLLGWFPAGTKIGFEGSAWLGTLPPFVFILCIIGMVRLRASWVPWVFGYLALLIAGDSLTYFSGIHLNRHVHILAPFFFGFGLLFLRALRIDGESLYPLGLGFVLVMVLLQSVGVLAPNSATVTRVGVDKEIADFVRQHHPDEEVIDQQGGPRYWLDGSVRWHSLSVGDNPYLGRYVRHHMRILETSEYIQRNLPPSILHVSWGSGDLFETWFRQFAAESLATFKRDLIPVALLRRLDLSGIHDVPPAEAPYDELDVGDPMSERQCRYRYRDSLERSAGGFLLPGQGFWDGGRPSVIRERFDLHVPEGGGVLVARTKGAFSGNVLELYDKTPVDLRVDAAEMRVIANGTCIADTTVPLGEGFSYVSVPVRQGGRVRFEIEGLFHSFHYWTYPPDTRIAPLPPAAAPDSSIG